MNRLYRLLTPASLSGMFFLAMLLLMAALIIVFSLPLNIPASSSPPTAVLNRIPAATATPLPPPPTNTSEPSATPEILPSPQPGEIGMGGYVQVSGTGLDGLRVRAESSLGAKTLFVAIESEVFQVTDGPLEADGYTWWRLLSPSNEQAQGWAVANYLVAIERP